MIRPNGLDLVELLILFCRGGLHSSLFNFALKTNPLNPLLSSVFERLRGKSNIRCVSFGPRYHEPEHKPRRGGCTCNQGPPPPLEPPPNSNHMSPRDEMARVFWGYVVSKQPPALLIDDCLIRAGLAKKPPLPLSQSLNQNRCFPTLWTLFHHLHLLLGICVLGNRRINLSFSL